MKGMWTIEFGVVSRHASHRGTRQRAKPAKPLAAVVPMGYGSIVCGLDAKVLVLNKVYRAIRVVSAKRAFTMLCKDLAEVIHVDEGQYNTYDFATWTEISELQREFEPDQHDWVRTVSLHLAVPKVIRLLGYDRLPMQRVKLNRRNLFARDKNRCQYCGKHFSTSELTLDHVLPRSQGGGDSWENLVCACVRCNARKGGRTPEQARMHLVNMPKRPTRHPLISVRLGQERYQTWKAFLDEAYWSVELK
jgi:5-methylcytosine-specific restriction endonuclease McrA